MIPSFCMSLNLKSMDPECYKLLVNYDRKIILLTEAGYKPVGEVNFDESLEAELQNAGFDTCVGKLKRNCPIRDISEEKKLMDHLTSKNYSYEIVPIENASIILFDKGDVVHRCFGDKEKMRIIESADSQGINYKIIPSNKMLVVYDVPSFIRLWNKYSDVDKKLIGDLKDTPSCSDNQSFENIRDFGRLFGYPDCCIDELIDLRKEDITLPVKKFHKELRDRVKADGIFGIEHLVGIDHIPCHLDCEKTKEKHVSEFIKKNVPYLFVNELRDLLSRCNAPII